MGAFSRLGEILNANINHMLDGAENPGKMVRLMIHELEDMLTEIKSSAAEVIAERIRTERQLNDWIALTEDWESKAMLALERGVENLAREALEQKLVYARRTNSAQEHLEEVSGLAKRYQRDIGKLEDQLRRAHQRRRKILAKANLGHGVPGQTGQQGVAFAGFARLEDSLDQLEARVEVGLEHAATNLSAIIQELKTGERPASEGKRQRSQERKSRRSNTKR